MSYCFDANHIFQQDNGHMIVLGFADDENEPSKFIILQKAKGYNEQDGQMRMDNIHIQVEDQSRSLYGGISLISIEGKRLLIKLESNATSTLQTNGNIEINLDLKHPQLSAALTILKEITKDEGISFNYKDDNNYI